MVSWLLFIIANLSIVEARVNYALALARNLTKVRLEPKNYEKLY
jgi:hypothetical protein